MAETCTNMDYWILTAEGMKIPSCPGFKYNPHCCMYNPHINEMDSWKGPLLSYYLKVQKEASRKMRSIPSMNFTGDDEEDWELIAQHINFLIDFHFGITVHASNNQLSELAIKINQAVTNRQLTITQQTINVISGPVGFTTADSVVAGYQPELIKLNKINP